MNPFWLGILAAVASYVLTEAIKRGYTSIQFRRSLVQDINATVTDLQSHRPDLGNLGPNIDTSKIRFIWDGSPPSAMATLIVGTAALSPVEKIHCSRFYSECGRIEEIRDAYNDAVKSFAYAESVEIAANPIAIAKGCLTDLERFYDRAMNAADEALGELEKHRWFLGIDEAQLVQRRIQQGQR